MTGEAILAYPSSTIWVGCSVSTRRFSFLRSTSPVRALNRQSSLIRQIDGTGIKLPPYATTGLTSALPALTGRNAVITDATGRPSCIRFICMLYKQCSSRKPSIGQKRRQGKQRPQRERSEGFAPTSDPFPHPSPQRTCNAYRRPKNAFPPP